MAYAIDELEPGMSESMTRIVGEADIERFAEATGDYNPVHFDEAFAAGTIFRGRVAHGVLSAGFVSAVLGTKMPGPGTVFLCLALRFLAPVRIGDTVIATCTVREIDGKRRVVFDCRCAVEGKVVTEGEAVVMPPLRPRS